MEWRVKNLKSIWRTQVTYIFSAQSHVQSPLSILCDKANPKLRNLHIFCRKHNLPHMRKALGLRMRLSYESACLGTHAWSPGFAPEHHGCQAILALTEVGHAKCRGTLSYGKFLSSEREHTTRFIWNGFPLSQRMTTGRWAGSPSQNCCSWQTEHRVAEKERPSEPDWYQRDPFT